MRIFNRKQVPQENDSTYQLENQLASLTPPHQHTDYSVLIEAIFRNDIKFHIKLLDQLVAGVFITYNQLFVYVNPYFAELLGYAPHEIIGQPIDKFLEEEDWHIIYPYDLYSADIIVYSPIYRWNGTHRDGSKIFLEGRSNEIGNDQAKYKLITVQDVTVKYDKERQLIENAKIYHRILMAIPEPVFITADSDIIFANKHGLELIGHRQVSAIMEKKFHEYFRKEDQLDILQSFNSALTRDDPTPFKPVHMLVNDNEVEFELSCVKIDNYIGQRVILSVMRDLTDRKENEERIIRSEKLSVIGQLAAGVAHEIRNPLTALKGFTQLLRSKYSDHSYYFDIMANEIDRINLIVNEFMTLAKPHYSSFQYNDINLLLKSVLSILDTQATLHNVQVSFNEIEDLPKVFCNENQLKQVFLNLIKNAIESMHSGGLVSIKITYNLEQRVIHVIIQDEGSGMPETVRKRIGEPFLTTKEKGTGLGLMVTSRIIEEHNGKMDIMSEEGVGTIIDVQIPIDNPNKQHN